MSNFDEGDEGPSHMATEALNIQSVPSVADFGAITLQAMGGD